MIQRLYLLITLIFCFSRANAQSLTIINNTGCKLRFTLYGSVQSPCGEECFFNDIADAGKGITWGTPAHARWSYKGDKSVYWRAFSLRYDYAPVIGNCNEAPPFSGVITVPKCGDVEYGWNVDEITGNISVNISPVIIPKNIISWHILPETISGGINVVIVPMMEISRFIDISEDADWLGKDEFRVRTNQKFIVSATSKGTMGNNNSIQLIADKNMLYNNFNVCSSLPLSAGSTMVTINCYSGTDQKFNVIVKNTGRAAPLIYTATEP